MSTSVVVPCNACGTSLNALQLQNVIKQAVKEPPPPPPCMQQYTKVVCWLNPTQLCTVVYNGCIQQYTAPIKLGLYTAVYSSCMQFIKMEVYTAVYSSCILIKGKSIAYSCIQQLHTAAYSSYTLGVLYTAVYSSCMQFIKLEMYTAVYSSCILIKRNSITYSCIQQLNVLLWAPSLY